MLGDDGECCHDVSLLLSVVEARVAAAYFANLSSPFLSLPAAGSERPVKVHLCGRLVVELSGRAWRNAFRIYAQSTLRRSAVNWSVALRLEQQLLRVQVFSTYDEGVKQIPCVCGYFVKGEDDDEVWQNAQAHLREDHPDLVGKVSRADLLAQAEEVPKPTS
jgi:hypothetical protein